MGKHIATSRGSLSKAAAHLFRGNPWGWITNAPIDLSIQLSKGSRTPWNHSYHRIWLLRDRGYPVIHVALLCATILVGMLPVNVLGQQLAATLARVDYSLPEAPLPQSNQESPTGQAALAGKSATVSGTVTDGSGATVGEAQVSLKRKDETPVQMRVSGGDGKFAFNNVPPATYLVTVNASGFAPYISALFDVALEQVYEPPNISLNVEMTSSTVTVRPTEVIAAEQVKAEEKQRLIGVFPNFYVSYIYGAAPLTSKQKFSLATRDTFDWTFLIGVSAVAGAEQANNNFAGYGQGASGYANGWPPNLRTGEAKTS